MIKRFKYLKIDTPNTTNITNTTLEDLNVNLLKKLPNVLLGIVFGYVSGCDHSPFKSVYGESIHGVNLTGHSWPFSCGQKLAGGGYLSYRTDCLFESNWRVNVFFDIGLGPHEMPFFSNKKLIHILYDQSTPDIYTYDDEGDILNTYKHVKYNLRNGLPPSGLGKKFKNQLGFNVCIRLPY
jgi:hypothetical protein